MAIAHANIGAARYRTTIRTGGDLQHQLIADEPPRLNGALRPADLGAGGLHGHHAEDVR